MSYSVLVSGRARRELRSFSKEIVARIDQQIVALAEDPRPRGSKKLRSKSPEGWRVRVGDYRILYRIDDLKRVVIDDLLGREPVSLVWNPIREGLSGKRVMITGGGGSIGSELCRQIARLNPPRSLPVCGSSVAA